MSDIVLSGSTGDSAVDGVVGGLLGQLPLLPIEEWTRERMHAAYWLLVTVFNRPWGVTLPLGYPDAADEFFGYARRTVRLPTGVEVSSTRDLIRVTGWIATALLALQAHVYVARKKECHDSYSHYIGGPWATLLHDIYHRLRTQWGYLIPAGSAERGELRALGEQTVRFENHFLVIYREYLLAQLDADGPTAPGRALWVLEHLPFRDAGVRLAVQRIARHHEDAELRGAAERVQALR